MVKSWWLMASLALAALPALAQPQKIAVIGLIHSHEGTYVPRMTRSEQVKLVGIAESIPDLVKLAKESQGAKDVPFFDDYKKMLDETKPDFVWAFVENNRPSADGRTVVFAAGRTGRRRRLPTSTCARRALHVEFPARKQLQHLRENAAYFHFGGAS